MPRLSTGADIMGTEIMKVKQGHEVSPIRVLYVLGAARSGSTVLNTLLGSHSDIVGTGELGFLSHVSNVFGEICSCGAKSTECEFWSRVCEEWKLLGGPESLEEYVALQRRFEGGRLWPRQSVSLRQRKTSAYVRYAALAVNLLEAIRRVSGKSIIVDSTKTPWRARVLASLPGVELRVVHLVRHPAGVVWSLKKALKKDALGVLTHKEPRSVVRSSVYWFIVNCQSGMVRRHLRPGHSMRVRYEDLVQRPVETMRDIGRLVDCDLESVGQQAAHGNVFDVGHTIAGNRLRMAGAVQLRMDSEWKNHLSRADRIVCGVVTGCLAKWYGFANVLGLS